MATRTSKASSNPKKPGGESAGRTNNALLKKCGELLRLFVEARKSDIKKRRNFAVACHDVCNAAEYGSNAVKKAVSLVKPCMF